ncbi:MAG: DUF4870 domain-containing protein [Protaetiibacter sp.]
MTAVPPPPSQTPGYLPVAEMNPADQRLWSTLAHVGGIVGNFFSAGWIVALVAYLILKERGAFVRSHTATELNFQLTLLIAYLGAFVITLVSFGVLFIVLLVPAVIGIVFGIIAALAANKGEFYSYPVSIRFVS